MTTAQAMPGIDTAAELSRFADELPRRGLLDDVDRIARTLDKDPS